MKWTDQKRRVNKQSGCNRDEEILEVITLLCAVVPLVEVTANQNEAPGGVWRLIGALAKRQRFKYLGSFRTPGKGLTRLNTEMTRLALADLVKRSDKVPDKYTNKHIDSPPFLKGLHGCVTGQ